jgi:hypothetical protein
MKKGVIGWWGHYSVSYEQTKSLDYIFHASVAVTVIKFLKVGSFVSSYLGEILKALLFSSVFPPCVELGRGTVEGSCEV